MRKPTQTELDAQIEALRYLLPAGMPEELVTLAVRRYIAGAEEYGEAWRERDNVAELMDELADAVSYTAFAVWTKQLSHGHGQRILRRIGDAARAADEGRTETERTT